MINYRKIKHPDIDKAYTLALTHHEGQFRRDNKTPYITHPEAVVKILKDKFRGIDFIGLDEKTPIFLIIVSYLHDIIEDTDVTYEYILESFNKEIADAVLALSKKENEKKVDYLERILASDDKRIILIKIADRISNLRDSKDLKNTEENISFKIYYLKRTKKYFFPIIKNSLLKKELMLAWYELRESLCQEKYKVKI